MNGGAPCSFICAIVLSFKHCRCRLSFELRILLNQTVLAVLILSDNLILFTTKWLAKQLECLAEYWFQGMRHLLRAHTPPTAPPPTQCFRPCSGLGMWTHWNSPIWRKLIAHFTVSMRWHAKSSPIDNPGVRGVGGWRLMANTFSFAAILLVIRREKR